MTEKVRTARLTPANEIRSRINNFQRKMAEQGVELSLILQNADLFYFAGTIQKGFLFIPQEGEPILFLQKNFVRGAEESPLRSIKLDSPRTLPKLMQEEGLVGKRVGMELDVVPVSLYERIRDWFQEWEPIDISNEIRDLRSVKSEFEIEQIRRSGEIIDRVFSGVKDYLREGMSEQELDGILTSIGRAHGHQGFLRMRGINQEMMNIHVLSGESASVNSFCDTPLGGPGVTAAIAQGSSGKRIMRDEPVVIDYGGGYNGYVTDETRTFVIGRLKHPIEKAYRVALDMIEDLESSARAGVPPALLYDSARERARKEGLAPNFMGHGEGKVAFVGHGFGLEINEWPVIGKGFRKPLQGGMVFAFEPKFVFPGEGAVGVELDYIVRENRVERVTAFPKEIISL
jgi:Xaa-Pro dipeptidase